MSAALCMNVGKSLPGEAPHHTGPIIDTRRRTESASSPDQLIQSNKDLGELKKKILLIQRLRALSGQSIRERDQRLYSTGAKGRECCGYMPLSCYVEYVFCYFNLKLVV